MYFSIYIFETSCKVDDFDNFLNDYCVLYLSIILCSDILFYFISIDRDEYLKKI